MRFADTNILLYAISRDPDEQAKTTLANELLSVSPTGMPRSSRRARTLGCDVVLSEDLNDGQDYAGVRVENPFSAGTGSE